uniref:Calponin-homology (CH) domain-containing protein n=1 Tax=Ditylenchus dipsaci TaxID=166011 RepID=A0A915E2W2_9BILA
MHWRVSNVGESFALVSFRVGELVASQKEVSSELPNLLWITDLLEIGVHKEDDPAIDSAAFLQVLSNGVLLARLANALKPGSVQCVHTKDINTQKAYRQANVTAFLLFAKNDANLESSHVSCNLKRDYVLPG